MNILEARIHLLANINGMMQCKCNEHKWLKCTIDIYDVNLQRYGADVIVYMMTDTVKHNAK